MKVNIIAIGQHLPPWIEAGFEEYNKRLSGEFQLKLIEIPAEKRFKNADITKILAKEGALLLKAVPKGSYLIALERAGEAFTSEKLADKLATLKQNYREISFLIGGPEGLSPQCLTEASACWSLSLLTLPHPLVRIILAEQIYRASSILARHPYHR